MDFSLKYFFYILLKHKIFVCLSNNISNISFFITYYKRY